MSSSSGAGLSGIGSGLATSCTGVPNRSFRDPGKPSRHWRNLGSVSAIRVIRSDSDMHTLGYAFQTLDRSQGPSPMARPFSGTSTRRLTSMESANTCASGTGSEARTGRATKPSGPWRRKTKAGCCGSQGRMLMLCGGYYNYEKPETGRPGNGEADFRGKRRAPTVSGRRTSTIGAGMSWSSVSGGNRHDAGAGDGD